MNKFGERFKLEMILWRDMETEYCNQLGYNLKSTMIRGLISYQLCEITICIKQSLK